jgi:hypothetical protein
VIVWQKRGSCSLAADCAAGMSGIPWEESLVLSENRFRSECEVRGLGVELGGTLQRRARVEIGGLSQWCVEFRGETMIDGRLGLGRSRLWWCFAREKFVDDPALGVDGPSHPDPSEARPYAPKSRELQRWLPSLPLFEPHPRYVWLANVHGLV